jgi:hypothetical protein
MSYSLIAAGYCEEALWRQQAKIGAEEKKGKIKILVNTLPNTLLENELEAYEYLLLSQSFGQSLKVLCPDLTWVEMEASHKNRQHLGLVATVQGSDSRTYERLGLLNYPAVANWVETRGSVGLWIDGFHTRPDWTTQLSLDVIAAAEFSGNVSLSLMVGEHNSKDKFRYSIAWALSFIDQLIAQRPNYLTLEEQCTILKSIRTASKDDFQAVWQIFTDSVRNVDFGFVYIVIDNIDAVLTTPEHATDIQDFLAGLDCLSQIPHRAVKTLITSRRSVFDIIKAPPILSVVSVTPSLRFGKKAINRQGILQVARKPKQRFQNRLPDRETANDVMLSDESSWDDEELDFMLQTTDEEGKKAKTYKKRVRRKSSLKQKPLTREYSLGLDSEESDDLEMAKPPRRISKSRNSQTEAKGNEVANGFELDSEDSLDSLDSIKEALKTSSDEDEVKKDGT